MTKIVRTATQATSGVKDHNVRYVLAGSLAFVVIALIIILLCGEAVRGAQDSTSRATPYPRPFMR
jgi:ABC-type proline/glycine betaine transport system permease subunit